MHNWSASPLVAVLSRKPLLEDLLKKKHSNETEFVWRTNRLLECLSIWHNELLRWVIWSSFMCLHSCLKLSFTTSLHPRTQPSTENLNTQPLQEEFFKRMVLYESRQPADYGDEDSWNWQKWLSGPFFESWWCPPVVSDGNMKKEKEIVWNVCRPPQYQHNSSSVGESPTDNRVHDWDQLYIGPHRHTQTHAIAQWATNVA